MSSSYPVIKGDSIYKIVDGPSWTEAEANAQKLGGHLVSINDAEENTFVWENLGKAASLKGGTHNVYEANHVYLGATDREQEGIWKWLDGSDMSYSFWRPDAPGAPGAPDNESVANPLVPGEDYLVYQAANGVDGQGTFAGYWDDARDEYYLSLIHI